MKCSLGTKKFKMAAMKNLGQSAKQNGDYLAIHKGLDFKRRRYMAVFNYRIVAVLQATKLQTEKSLKKTVDSLENDASRWEDWVVQRDKDEDFGGFDAFFSKLKSCSWEHPLFMLTFIRNYVRYYVWIHDKLLFCCWLYLTNWIARIWSGTVKCDNDMQCSMFMK